MPSRGLGTESREEAEQFRSPKATAKRSWSREQEQERGERGQMGKQERQMPVTISRETRD